MFEFPNVGAKVIFAFNCTLKWKILKKTSQFGRICIVILFVRENHNAATVKVHGDVKLLRETLLCLSSIYI